LRSDADWVPLDLKMGTQGQANPRDHTGPAIKIRLVVIFCDEMMPQIPGPDQCFVAGGATLFVIR
jgi:hypothetical protein